MWCSIADVYKHFRVPEHGAVLIRTYVYIQYSTVHPVTCHEGQESKQRYSSSFSLTSALHGGQWLMPGLGRFTPGKESRYQLYRTQDGTTGPVWTGV
jgi:hypothetical protein